MKRTYELRILGVFLLALAVYLGLAWTVLEPLGYYGTIEQPRFADPWIARAETILGGGMLYRDVFTTTPPLMNFLLIPPVVFSGLFAHQNPWATMSFMVYFSLFNLLSAYVLLYMADNKEEGYKGALAFLLNPLTFGNAVLRRQDEAVLTFFFALALLCFVHNRHLRSGVVMGLSLLIKMTGGMMIPVAFLNTWDWRYLIIPFVVFGLVFMPFYLGAGESAIYWNPSQEHAEHPFQLGGVGLSALWVRGHGGGGENVLNVNSLVFIVGVCLVLCLIAFKPQGMVSDLALLVTVVLLLSPKLHCGYFSILVLVMTPLVARYHLTVPYFAFSTLALVADIYKWPVENFRLAFWLMVCVALILTATMARLWLLTPKTESKTGGMIKSVIRKIFDEINIIK